MRVFFVIAISLWVFFSGCAEIKTPTPLDVLKAPLGRNPVEIGMTRAEVLERWGDPDEINPDFIDEKRERMEQWIYFARYPKDPFQINYLATNKYVYFVGERAIRIHE